MRAEQKDKRHDLFALATSYIGQLKVKLPSLISEDAFHQKSPEKSVAKLGEPRVVKIVENKNKGSESKVPVESRPLEPKLEEVKPQKQVKPEEKSIKVENRTMKVDGSRSVSVSYSTSAGVKVEREDGLSKSSKPRKSESKGSSGHKEARKKRKLEAKETTKAPITI